MEVKHDLCELFDLCLKATYRHTEMGGDYAFVRKGKTLYLLFQWSNGCEDWKHNLDFPVAPYEDMGKHWYCHRGFLKVFKAIKPHIVQTLKTTDAKEMIVVGYSHGAAIATLAHEYIWYHRPDLRENLWGYGFGCPRCFWMPYICEDLRSRWTNFFPIRNRGDLVTHLPPAFLGYRHVNRPVKVGTFGKYNMFNAHRPENYERELKLWQEEARNIKREGSETSTSR